MWPSHAVTRGWPPGTPAPRSGCGRSASCEAGPPGPAPPCWKIELGGRAPPLTNAMSGTVPYPSFIRTTQTQCKHVGAPLRKYGRHERGFSFWDMREGMVLAGAQPDAIPQLPHTLSHTLLDTMHHILLWKCQKAVACRLGPSSDARQRKWTQRARGSHNTRPHVGKLTEILLAAAGLAIALQLGGHLHLAGLVHEPLHEVQNGLSRSGRRKLSDLALDDRSEGCLMGSRPKWDWLPPAFACCGHCGFQPRECTKPTVATSPCPADATCSRLLPAS